MAKIITRSLYKYQDGFPSDFVLNCTMKYRYSLPDPCENKFYVSRPKTDERKKIMNIKDGIFVYLPLVYITVYHAR